MQDALEAVWAAKDPQQALESLRVDREWEKLALLESILGLVHPKDIPRILLPDSRRHGGWYLNKATELAVARHLDAAIALLNISDTDDPAVQRLRLTLLRFQMIDGILRTAAPGGANVFTVEEYLKGGTAALFNSPAIRIVGRDGLFRQLLTRGLFDTCSEFHRQAPRCGKGKLHPILATRLPRPPSSLQGELEALRGDPMQLRTRVQSVLELMVRRRELGDMDLDCWRELGRYEEFLSDKVEYDQLEARCFEELENISSSVN